MHTMFFTLHNFVKYANTDIDAFKYDLQYILNNSFNIITEKFQ